MSINSTTLTHYGYTTLNRLLPFIPGRLEKIATSGYVKNVFATLPANVSFSKLLDPKRIQFARIGFIVGAVAAIFAVGRIVTQKDFVLNPERNDPYFPRTLFWLSAPTACLCYSVLQQSNEYLFNLTNLVAKR